MAPASDIPPVTLNDDNTIPALGIGVADLSATEAEAAVSAALAAGYRLIDAGRGNDEAVGRAVAASGIARDDLFITTTMSPDEQGFQSSQEACTAALERMGLDYLDLYLVSWPVEEKGKYVDAWGGIMKSREIGQIRSIGIANFTSEQLSDIIDLSFFIPAVHQIELHPRLNQSDLRAVHAQHNIVTEAVCPLATGTLLGDPAVAAVAGAHGKSAAQALIRWNLQLGNVVVPRTSDPAKLAENIDVFDFTLTDAEMESLNGLDNGTRFRPNPDA